MKIYSKFFINEKKGMNSQIKIKIIHTIIIAMKLAKYFDKIVNEEKKSS